MPLQSMLRRRRGHQRPRLVARDRAARHGVVWKVVRGGGLRPLVPVGAQINVAALHAIDAHRFRRVYQHFGSPKGYEVLPDAAVFLDKIPDSYLLGICSNTPNRHSASVLPMLGIHERFKFFARDAASRSRRRRRDTRAQVLAGRRVGKTP